MRENEIEARDAQVDPLPGDVKWQTTDPKCATYMMQHVAIGMLSLRESANGEGITAPFIAPFSRWGYNAGNAYTYGTAGEHASALAGNPPAPRVVSVAALNTLLDILTAPPVPFPGESPTKRMEVLNMHTGRCQVAQSIRELIAKVGG